MELAGVAGRGHDRRGGDHTAARDGRKSTARFILAVPFEQEFVELLKFVFQFEESVHQRGQCHLRHLGEHVLRIALIEYGAGELHEVHHTGIADQTMLIGRIQLDSSDAVVDLAQRLCIAFDGPFVSIEVDDPYLRRRHRLSAVPNSSTSPGGTGCRQTTLGISASPPSGTSSWVIRKPSSQRRTPSLRLEHRVGQVICAAAFNSDSDAFYQIAS